MKQTVTALYDTYDDAVAAAGALAEAGIPISDISIISNNADNRSERTHHAADDAKKGAGIGAAVGGIGGLLTGLGEAAVGGIGGLLTGLGVMAIPGVGPVVAAGWLAATGAPGGAVIGGAAGGLVGMLTSAGVPEQDANIYAEGVRRGGTLVAARVADAQAPIAHEILRRYRCVDPMVRAAAYRESGWSSFDENAPVYSPEQIAEERARYGKDRM
jgi:hypothetical protein